MQLNADRPEEAKPFLERALALAPENAEVHYLLGTVPAREGEFAKAVGLLKRFLEMAPADDRSALEQSQHPGHHQSRARRGREHLAHPEQVSQALHAGTLVVPALRRCGGSPAPPLDPRRSLSHGRSPFPDLRPDNLVGVARRT